MSLFTESDGTFNGKLFGFLTVKLSGLSSSQTLAMFTLALVTNLGAALLTAWGFQFLWAWYMPVFWASIPILGYWHSLVTMLLLGLLGKFLYRGKN